MPALQGKAWFRNNIIPYLTKIKAELANVANITGNYAGKGATFAALPTTDPDASALEPGDWGILTLDDVGAGTVTTPQYPAGIYVWNAAGTDWELVQENQDLSDVLNTIVATPAEVDAGTATDKVASVNQLAIKYAKINGNSSELFSTAAGNINTNESLNANQFSSVSITLVEAASDYASA
jgi:hypothetical protein